MPNNTTLDATLMLTAVFVVTMGLLTLFTIVSKVNSMEKRIEKLQSSVSILSERPCETKAQLYLEKFGDHEFPPACDPIDEE